MRPMYNLQMKNCNIRYRFPMRYSHSSREICNLNDLIDLKIYWSYI